MRQPPWAKAAPCLCCGNLGGYEGEGAQAQVSEGLGLGPSDVKQVKPSLSLSLPSAKWDESRALPRGLCEEYNLMWQGGQGAQRQANSRC